MGRDNQPKHRQQRKLERKQDTRAPHDCVLIVCEGEKTEPNYFGAIKRALRLRTANIKILPSTGTSPLQVVEYAEEIFLNGDPNNGIAPLSFEQVFAVFDRDDHHSFHNALSKAEGLDQSLTNDEGDPITFRAIPSNPCFEFWLLLHFEDVQCLLHRDEVMRKLKVHYPDYEKNARDVYERTKANLDMATQRAERFATGKSPHNDDQPFTAVHKLVKLLTTLED